MIAAISPQLEVTAASAARETKSLKAARDFEAILLNQMLSSLQHSFASLPGEKENTRADHYQSLGVQELSAQLAGSGGIGIGKMIKEYLQRMENR